MTFLWSFKIRVVTIIWIIISLNVTLSKKCKVNVSLGKRLQLRIKADIRNRLMVKPGVSDASEGTCVCVCVCAIK